MKIATRIVQVIVALLFIVSGLVKANDPLGLAYKMEEFFQLWTDTLNNGHFFARGPLVSLINFFDHHTLFLAISMITLEIVSGVALLLRWAKRFILWLLLLLIIFFAFLTGYAYLSGKFTNCGCFGDCLPITPLTSFTKDLILLVMISFLIAYQRYIVRLLGRLSPIIVFGSLFLAIFIQWYVLNYLPLVDCLPMRKGNNLSEQTKPPKDAKPPVYETTLIYQNKKSGELKEMSQSDFNASKIWEDSAWKWKDTKTKLVYQGSDVPKLQNFSLKTLSGVDSTQAILNYPGYYILYFINPKQTRSKIDFTLLDHLWKSGIPSYIITSSPGDFSQSPSNYPVLSCDGTVFRIAARVNPTIYFLKQGTVINKWPPAAAGQVEKFINELKK
ncbi:MAG: BT_3928 family protein [Flavisolibacter sp.]